MAENQKRARINYGLTSFISTVLAVLLLNSSLMQAYGDEEIHYNLLASGTNSVNSICSSDVDKHLFEGEEFLSTSVLVGEAVNRFVISLDRDGSSPDGYTFLIGIWDSTVAPTSSNYLRLIATVSLSDIASTGFQDYTYNFDDYTITADDMIGVYYDDGEGCDANNYPRVEFATNVFDSTDSRRTQYDSDGGDIGFADVTSNDLIAKISYVDGEGVGGVVCPAGMICLDFDDDGVIDDVLDEEGDSIYNINYSDIPAFVGPISESAPNFMRAITGLNVEASGLLIALLVHGAALMVPGFILIKTGANIPMFVWAFFMILGGGIATAAGFMPLLYFFVELAAVVGGTAALVKSGVLGG